MKNIQEKVERGRGRINTAAHHMGLVSFHEEEKMLIVVRNILVMQNLWMESHKAPKGKPQLHLKIILHLHQAQRNRNSGQEKETRKMHLLPEQQEENSWKVEKPEI